MQRILGTSEDTGKLLGLDKDWAYRAHQVRRQLRRDLRAQCRPEVGAEAAARRQQPVEQGRPDVRAAGALDRTQDRDGHGPVPRRQARRGSGGPPRARTPSPRTPARWRLQRSSSDGRGAARRCAVCSTRSWRWSCWSLPPAGTSSTTRCSTCACAGSRAASTSCCSRPASPSAKASCDFDSAESYPKAFAVGLSNTLRVALLGIVLATITGHARSASAGCRATSWCARFARAYVELFRNVPLLLQLFIWYFILTEFLPPIDEALQPDRRSSSARTACSIRSRSGRRACLHGCWAWSLGIVAAWDWAKLRAAPLRGHAACPAGGPAGAAGADRRRRVPRLAGRRRAERARDPGEDDDHRGRRRRRSRRNS